MKTCATCQFWRRNKDDSYRAGTGLCDRTISFWDATEWSEDCDKRVFKRDAENITAFAQDGSDYIAQLYTKPEHGCTMHAVYVKGQQ
jgi:hypothetical protein